MKHWIDRFILTLFVAVLLYPAMAQRVIDQTEAVELALKNSGEFQSADLQIKQNRYLQKTGLNLPNPEVIAESPTGEFYAVGILQSLDFPSVYVKQRQLRKQFTKLSERQKEITKQDIASLVRSLYLNVQLAEALYKQLRVQDTLYDQISKSAERQFAAGTIDYLAKTFAQTQAGEIHNQLIQTREEYLSVVSQLSVYLGLSDSFKTAPIQRLPYEEFPTRFDSTMILSNPSIQYYQQLQSVNRTTLAVERQKALPGLVFGYLNQGAKTTDTYYRFRVGFTVPLWFWQYSGNIKAAKTGVQIAEQDSKAQRQTLTSDMVQALGDLRKYRQSLDYYESKGLKQTDDIINTARRFFESGQDDYIGYLRNINEAYLIKARYLETLRNYNQSVITINYLTGKL
jgi:outer membrane protein, heavy metal efflux system